VVTRRVTPRQFVSIQEAAELASVNPKTIRRRIEDGTFTAHRFGPRLIRLDLAEVDAYINGHRVDTDEFNA
jgi:excisionase family DNA binding protein